MADRPENLAGPFAFDRHVQGLGYFHMQDQGPKHRFGECYEYVNGFLGVTLDRDSSLLGKNLRNSHSESRTAQRRAHKSCKDSLQSRMKVISELRIVRSTMILNVCKAKYH